MRTPDTLAGTGVRMHLVVCIILLCVCLILLSVFRLVAAPRDIGNGVAYDSWPYPSTRSIKVSTFLYDVPPDGGCLTFVPGSHRLPNAPQQTLDGTFAGGRGHYRKPLRPGQALVPGSNAGTGSSPNGGGSFFHARKGLELPRGYDDDGRPLWVADEGDLPSVAMPNCVRCAVPAGSFVLFDTCKLLVCAYVFQNLQ